MSTATTDIIDLLAGIEPGSSLSAIRDRRLQARENAQKSYLSLFEPADFGDVAASERYAVAAFVAGVHDEPAVANFLSGEACQGGRWGRPGRTAAGRNRASKDGRSVRRFSAGPLSVEDKAGLIYRVSARRPACPRPPAWRFSRARASAGIPPARRCSRGHAVAAGCRLVDHRDRDVVATGCVPVVSGSRRLRPADAWRLARQTTTAVASFRLRSRNHE